MRSRAERISRALVRRYPRAWRERYGEEMLALIDDAGSTWKHTLDLAIGCADAWLRAALRFGSVINWLHPLAGIVSVRVASATARHFGLIPPVSMQHALLAAFLLLWIFILGSEFVVIFLGFAVRFRKAWTQWFGMIRGHMPEAVDPHVAADSMKTITNLVSTRRLVRFLAAVTILTAIGADIYMHDRTVTPVPVVLVLTLQALQHVRQFVCSLQALRLKVSERRRPSLVE